MEYKIHYTKTAINDLEKITNYISYTLFNPSAAISLLKKIEDKLSILKNNPLARPLVRDVFLSQKGIRFINANKYLVIYKIDDKENIVYVIHILYQGQDWLNILKNEFEF